MQLRLAGLTRPALAGIGATALLAGAAAPACAQTQEPDKAEDARILVTGTSAPIRMEQLGSAISVLEGEQIEAQGIAYLQDALRQVPGLSVSQVGGFGALSAVRIRGAEGNHTLVLIDGIEVSSVTDGEFDFSSLSGANIDRVEVLRGAQSGLYGANALAGVINVITKGGAGPLLDAAVEGGSYSSVMARGALNVGDRDSFLSASAIFRSTDGYSAAAIGNEDDGDRNFTTYLRGGIELAPFARFDASLRYVNKQTETDGFDFSGGALQGLAVDGDDYSDTRQFSGGAALTLDPSRDWQVVFTGSYSDYVLEGGTGNSATFGNKSHRFKAGMRSTFRFDSGPQIGHTLTAFLDHEEESFRHSFPSDPSQIASQRRDNLGVGAEYRIDLFDQLYLQAAIRRDANSGFADVTTYSFAGSWLMPTGSTRLHASYGRGVSNPTFFEQFGFTPGLFVGNPDLAPEKSDGWDAGIEQRLGTLGLIDVTYFSARLEDEIASAFPSVINQQGTSRREGVEVAARFDLGKIRLSGSYTYLDASDPDGSPETRRPEHAASLDASMDFGPANAGNISLGLLYSAGLYDDDFRSYFESFSSKKTRLDNYLVARLAASYQISETLRLTGRVENMFDADYEEAISYATPGLSAFGGLRLTL